MNETRNPHDDHGHQQWLDERVDVAVTVLGATEPALPADRIAFHREMLMNQITKPAPAATHDADLVAPVSEIAGHRRRRWLLAGAGAVAIGALIAGPAAADRLNEFIHRAPQSAQEADQMEVIYQGRSYSWTQIYALQEQGKAMATVEEPATYNKGQAYAFDTEAQATQWTCSNIAGLADRPICQTDSLTPVPSPS